MLKKILSKLDQKQEGQSIVIIALALVAMVALAALILDGGLVFMNRRSAQSAADAGALAAAYNYCNVSENTNVASAVGVDYAVNQNGATSAIASIDVVSRSATVDATWVADSFFAGVFGIEQPSVSASATARCFSPGGKNLLPIAWYCQPPWLPEEFDTWENGLCQFMALDWETQLKPLLNGSGGIIIDGYTETFIAPADFTGKNGTLLDEHIYVIIDDLAMTCPPDGGDDCDFNDDGRPDILSGGQRGWLELDGDAGGGTSSMVDWIRNGYEGLIQPHMWLPGQPGVAVNIYSAVTERAEAGDMALIPVFNTICPDLPQPGDACDLAAHSETPPGLPLEPDETCIYPEGSTQIYYHVIAFVEFYITCVDAGGNDACPGHQAAVDDGIIAANDKTIEGYFVTGYPLEDPIVGEGDIDMGVYVVSLID